MNKPVLWAAVAAFALAACGEKPQDLSQTKKADVPAWKGAANAYVAPGWTVGDQKSWEKQINARAQGQNEYQRISGGAL